MTGERPPAPDIDAYVDGVLKGDRALIARAITLVESSRADHRLAAEAMLERLLPHTGGARRVGISGVPGAGKSTFIDEVGTRLIGRGHKVAVLAVDPSSTRSGGSILGDKTRMARLASEEHAYIRPSPSAGTLGGVAAATRQAMLILEAAGYDVVIVETVGVGQSEVAVAGMVDCFVVLTVARTGDSLQGIKRGILELAELVVVNKADGGREGDARRTATDLREALHLFPPIAPGWSTPVITCSSLTGAGIDDVWDAIGRHESVLTGNGELRRRRADQQVDWMWSTVTERMLDRIRHDPSVRAMVPELEAAVRASELPATAGARQILEILSRAESSSED